MLRIPDSPPDESPPAKPRRSPWGWIAIVFFLGPAMFGFGTKFYELVRVFQGDPAGAFAVTPIVNYLLAGCGFLLLFAWATRNGMLRDIELPKTQMLENERRLDALSQSEPFPTA